MYAEKAVLWVARSLTPLDSLPAAAISSLPAPAMAADVAPLALP